MITTSSHDYLFSDAEKGDPTVIIEVSPQETGLIWFLKDEQSLETWPLKFGGLRELTYMPQGSDSVSMRGSMKNNFTCSSDQLDFWRIGTPRAWERLA